MENWKVILRENFDRIYEASDKGQIRKISTQHILKMTIRNGYNSVCLYNSETKQKSTVNVHRLIITAFLGQSEKGMVNHKNGDKLDNRIENLEWVTAKENTEHAIRTSLHKVHTKRVEQYDKNGNYIRTFNSILEASKESGASDRHISCVCKGKRKTTGGFIWKYETKQEVQNDCDGKTIVGFPNYKITKTGKVYSIRSKIFLVPKKLSSGYECVKLCNNGANKDVYIKKLVREYYPPESSVPNYSEKSDSGSRENLEVREESEDGEERILCQAPKFKSG